MSNVAVIEPKRQLIKDVEFRGLRIPYNDALGESFGIDNVRWKVLCDTVFPNATNASSIIMALTYCRARNLDIFKRPVHIVPMWSKAANGMIDTIWPSISELRTTAFRTGSYAGKVATAFGPDVIQKVGKSDCTFPEWAQITLKRIVGGHICEFEGPRVYWLESYAKAKRDDDTPNEIWMRRPHGQIDKCAEAAALRTAFPEEIGNEYAAEEMEGQRFIEDQRPSIPTPPEPPAIEPPKTEDEKFVEAVKTIHPGAEVVEQSEPPDYETIRALFKASSETVETYEALQSEWERIVDPHYDRMMPPDQEDITGLFRKAERRFEK
jgi:phage recombination protein Bet